MGNIQLNHKTLLLLVSFYMCLMHVYAKVATPPPPGTASIGDFVWLDTNKDGQQNGSEAGVSGVTITLYNNLGAIVAVTKTDATGKYVFSQLNAGTYTLLFTLPSNYIFTGKDTLGSTDLVDSDVFSTGESYGKTDGIVVTAGSVNTNVDAGIYFANSGRSVVGDLVWYDANNNGLQDATEKGVSDMTVILYDGTNNKIATTITDGNGKYHFILNTTGTYCVFFKLPIGYTFATRNAAGFTAANGSDAYNSGASFAKTDFFTVNSGDSISIWDAGLIRAVSTRASVGDQVWNDVNQNGIKETNEPGIPEVVVTLKNAVNTVIATTVTDELGNYMFTNLTANFYCIFFTLPTGYAFTIDEQGTGANDSDVPAALGKTELFSLKAGEHRTDLDAGMYQLSPVGDIVMGDRVWNDINRDGIQDATEPGVAGVTVTLYDITRTLVDQVVTDKNGNYVFVNVAPGMHCVGFSNLPDGAAFSPANQGGVEATDSDVEADGKCAMMNFLAGDVNLDLDAGLILGRSSIGKGVLGNTVWNDLNGNGIQNANEPLMAGIRVILYNEDGITPLDTTYTNGKGEYQFRNLPANPYILHFDNLPVGYTFTTQNQGTDDTKDSDVNGSGITGLVSVGSEENISNVDAGIRNVTNTALIGDYIWNDNNNNGVQDGSEVGIPGIMVTLFDNLGNELKTVISDENGFYLFPNLVAGTYTIGVSNIPTGLTIGLQAQGGNPLLDSDVNPGTGKSGNLVLVAGQNLKDVDIALVNDNINIGDFVWHDLNRDGKQDVGEPGIEGVEVTVYDVFNNIVAKAVTDEKGHYYFINIPSPENYSFEFSKYPTEMTFTAKDTLAGGANDKNDSDVDKVTHRTDVLLVGSSQVKYDIDAGLVIKKLGDVEGYVWKDMDRDGVQASPTRELPASGVTVTLYASNGTTVVASTVTGADGIYNFYKIPVGNYVLGFSTIPSNYVFTAMAQGGDPSTDSDVIGATGKTAIITIIEGTKLEGPDAGLSPTKGTIGDFVWLDTNQDGSQDPDEPGVSSVTVTLYNSSGAIVGTTKTDAYGRYMFRDIASGSYQIAVSLPIDYVLTVYNGGGGDRDNDINPTTGMSPLFVLSASADSNTIDAGIYFKNNVPTSIGNYVFFDGDGNGIQGANEKGVADVVVTLYNNAGKPLLTTVSDETGAFLFNNLLPGTYSIGASLPIGYQFALQDMGGNDNLDSDINAVTEISGPITLGNSDQQAYWDIGLRKTGSLRGAVGNKVWNDLDMDGIQDANELGVGGVKVDLYDGRLGTLVYSTITNAYGNYIFNNLVSNIYWLQLNLPAGWLPTSTNQGTDDELDSDIDGTGKTIRFAITDGDRYLEMDGGLYQTAPSGTSSIGNRVWADANMNGLQDAGERGITGVSVVLLSSSSVPLDTVSSNETGYYRFDALAAGNYYVQFINIPLGMNFTTKDADGVATNYLDSDANIATGTTDLITLSGQDTTIDVGLISLTKNAGFGSIGNKVWYDKNGNGQQDNYEAGVSGVTVTLTNITTSGTTVTKTDGTGMYIFNGLDAGPYKITVTLPATYIFTPQDASTDDIDSDVNTATGQSAILTLAEGESNISIDAGMYVSLTRATVGDYVWNDVNMDGVQNGSEKGVPGVTVTLYSSTLIPLQYTTTDNRGRYSFSDLAAGNYSIGFSNLPFDFVISPKNKSGNDLTDSDVSPNTGISAGFTIAASATKVDIDCGIYASNTAALGNYVWFDTNNNGLQDVSEKGAAGTTVTLFDGGGNAVVSSIADEVGYYYFSNLFPGDYIPGFVDIPSGARFTLQNVNNDSTDNDANTLGMVDTLTVLAATANLTIDGGIGSPIPSSLSGYAWGDYQSFASPTNKNGIQDAGEKPIPGVTVSLFNAANNTLLATAITNAEGKYTFNNIPAATYFLRFSTFSLNTRVTLKDQGGNDALDSDVDTVFLNAGPYTVLLGEAKEGADIGFVTAATIRGITFKDGLPNQANTADGFRNNQDPNNGFSAIDEVMGDVTVLLLSAFTNPPTIMRTSYSVEDGAYVFRNLDPSGKYFMAFESFPVFCATCDFTTFNANANVNDTTDSDVDPTKFIFTNGKNYMYTDTIQGLAPGANFRTLFAGFKQPGSAFPIELLSLTAVWKDIDALVQWTSNKEINSDYFGIERSLDNGYTFQLLTNIDAAGQSDVPLHYQFIDAGIGNFSQDKIYYRLKMVDIDGSFKYSDKVELVKADGLKSIYLDAFPNPTDAIINVNFHVEDEAKVELRLFNPLGQMLQTRLLQASKEPQSTKIDVSTYPEGTYYLQLNTNSNSIVKRIIVK